MVKHMDDKEPSARDFAAELAKALTTVTALNWKAEPDHRDATWYAEVWCQDGTRLGIGGAHEKGMFHISPSLSHFQDAASKSVQRYGDVVPGMNVSRTKDAFQAARDVSRRILVASQALTQEYAKRSVEHKAYSRRVKDTAELVAAVVGAKVITDRNNPGDPYKIQVDLYRSKAFPECLGDLKPGDGTVTFDRFEVGAEEAVAMLEALIRERSKRG